MEEHAKTAVFQRSELFYSDSSLQLFWKTKNDRQHTHKRSLSLTSYYTHANSKMKRYNRPALTAHDDIHDLLSAVTTGQLPAPLWPILPQLLEGANL